MLPATKDTAKVKKNILTSLYKDKNVFRLLIVTILIFALMTALEPSKFLSIRNFQSMSYQFPEFALLATAMMLTMITGGIDLSVVSTASLSGILSSIFMVRMIKAYPGSEQAVIIFLAIAIALATGIVCGLLNGIFISKIGISPILATLGTMQLYLGIAIIITKGLAVTGLSKQFATLGNGKITGIPIPLIIFILAIIIYAIILNRTTFGFKVYMLGANPNASMFAGISNSKILMKAYIMSGVLASISGIIIIARNNSAKADYGSSYILQAILVSLLGGVDPAGGFGKISGLILAVVSLQILSSGLNLLLVSSFLKELIWGALLIFVMVINYLSEVQGFKNLCKKIIHWR